MTRHRIHRWLVIAYISSSYVAHRVHRCLSWRCKVKLQYTGLFFVYIDICMYISLYTYKREMNSSFVALWQRNVSYFYVYIKRLYIHINIYIKRPIYMYISSYTYTLSWRYDRGIHLIFYMYIKRYTYIYEYTHKKTCILQFDFTVPRKTSMYSMRDMTRWYVCSASYCYIYIKRPIYIYQYTHKETYILPFVGGVVSYVAPWKRNASLFYIYIQRPTYIYQCIHTETYIYISTCRSFIYIFVMC